MTLDDDAAPEVEAYSTYAASAAAEGVLTVLPLQPTAREGSGESCVCDGFARADWGRTNTQFEQHLALRGVPAHVATALLTDLADGCNRLDVRIPVRAATNRGVASGRAVQGVGGTIGIALGVTIGFLFGLIGTAICVLAVAAAFGAAFAALRCVAVRRAERTRTAVPQLLEVLVRHQATLLRAGLLANIVPLEVRPRPPMWGVRTTLLSASAAPVTAQPREGAATSSCGASTRPAVQLLLCVGVAPSHTWQFVRQPGDGSGAIATT